MRKAEFLKELEASLKGEFRQGQFPITSATMITIFPRRWRRGAQSLR